MEDPVISKLVQKTWDKLQALPKDKRLIIGISGIPGSGKTTLAAILAKSLNALHQSHHPPTPSSSPSPSPSSPLSSSPPSPPIATVLPLDGYHLTRHQLSLLPSPDLALQRRGAAFTFDASRYVLMVRSLRGAPLLEASPPVLAASFDHALKDPVEDDLVVLPAHRVVFLEGLYVALDREPWRDAAALMDELWFVEVDVEVAARRLIRRHVETGVRPDVESAEKHVRGSDLLNAKDVVENRLRVDEIVFSGEDGSYSFGGHQQAEQ